MSLTMSLNILLVEDSESDARLIKEILREQTSITLDHVSSLKGAKESLKRNPSFYDIILLDLGLPDSQRLETLKSLLEYESRIPVVVMTGLDDEALSVDAIDIGAQDYLIKGKNDLNLLLRTIKYAIKRNALLMHLKYQDEEHINHAMTHDVLTNLGNDIYFQNLLEEKISQCKDEYAIFTVMLIKLHECDKISLLLGEDAKNKLILESACRLKSLARSSAFKVSQHTKDTFAILCHKSGDSSYIHELSEKFKKVLSVPLQLEDRLYYPVINIGIAVYPFDGINPSDLMSSAGVALINACDEGLNRIVYFSNKFKDVSKGQSLFLGDIKNALDNNEFQLYFQPQVDMKTKTISGVEGLIRWNNPAVGMIAPDTFIPLAEESGLILPIGEWVINKGFEYLRSWINLCSLPITFSLGLNVSIKQLQHGNLLQIINEALERNDLQPHHIELELTERIFADRLENIVETLERFREEGISISIDDFGTGYSSLSYLSHLPINKLKIDRMFVQKCLDHPTTASIIKSIIALAHDIDLIVIAEGVETKEEWDFILHNDCDLVQGYYCHKPMHPDDMEKMLKTEFHGKAF